MARPATLAEMADWVVAGRSDPKALEVCWHVCAARERKWTESDCPFGEEAPLARERWVGLMQAFERSREQQAQTVVLPPAGKPAFDPERFWWNRD